MAEGVEGVHYFVGVVYEVDVCAVVPLLIVDVAWQVLLATMCC